MNLTSGTSANCCVWNSLF